jgi:hypothetical protein
MPSNAELSGGRSVVQAPSRMSFRILSRRSTAMLPAPVRCSVGLGGRCRAPAETILATDRDGWSMPARVGRRPPVAHYRTTGSGSGSAGARARAKRDSPSHDRAGGTRTVLRRRAAAPRGNRRNRNQNHWHAFARITPKFSCKGFHKSARGARTINSSFVSCNACWAAAH